MRGRLPPLLLTLVPALAALAALVSVAANTSAAVSLRQAPGTARAPSTIAFGITTSPTSAANTAITTTIVQTSTAKTVAANATRPANTTTGPGMPGTSAAAAIAVAASSPRPATSTTADQGLTASQGAKSAAAATTVGPTVPAYGTSAMVTRGGVSLPAPPLPQVSAASRPAAAVPVPPIHVVSGPLIDDEDPPLPQPMSTADEDLPLIPSWSHRNANDSEADENMDVRSNNPRGGRAPPADPNALYQEAATPNAADDEAQSQAHPGWHLVNARRCGLSKNPFSDRIVGGAMAALGQYPWLARMGYNLDDVPRRVYRCAGAVITHLYVLTAAHCVKNLPQTFEFVGVRLGEWDTTTDPDCQNSVCAPAVYDVDPESVIVHQDYNNPRFANDIALVKLAQKINFNGWVAPVCIPYGDLLAKSFESERTEVAGWGIYDINLQKSSQELRMVHLPVVSNSICHALYRNQANITKKQMCAGGELGSDACSGDSGGPLLKVEAYSGGPRYYIVGIVSFGSRRCGLTPAPGVYTRVSYYVDWILDNIEQT